MNNINSRVKILIIYYSFEGSTRLLAESIANTVGADILELELEEEKIKSHEFSKYFWGGKQVFLREKPKLKRFDKDPEMYDIIFIGTPIWSFTYTPAVRTFLENQKLKNKKIALFCSHEGGKGKVFDNMKIKLCGNEFIGEKDFYKVFYDKDKSVDEAKRWIKDVIDEKTKNDILSIVKV